MAYQLGQIDSGRDEFVTEPRDHETRPRFRGLIATAAALLVMGTFAGGLWFAYHLGLRHAGVGSAGDVPLIRADERPTKAKPEHPGGMEIPDRDKLIYTLKRPGVEHLLPPPEKPMSRPTAQPTPQGEMKQPPTASGASAAATAAVSPTQPQQPGPKSAVKNSPPGVPTKATTQAAPVQPSGARIQLGSVRSEEAARHEWDRVRRANSDLLGSLSATAVRADLGAKGVFYRIQTGPTAEADRICGELKQRKIGCIIAR